ncbi:MAG: hypothetical protein Q7S22_02905 [Candidatus Micrarchaeota archaeon]|nr:hypothetical protein [Candidatus Micrarchaeota archaeon]
MSIHRLRENFSTFFRGLVRTEPLLEIAITRLKSTSLTEKEGNRHSDKILSTAIRLKLSKKRVIEVMEILKDNNELSQDTQMKLGIALSSYFRMLEKKGNNETLCELATVAYRILSTKRIISVIAEKELTELVARHGSISLVISLIEARVVSQPENKVLLEARVTGSNIEKILH